jgi:hypothetical protein
VTAGVRRVLLHVGREGLEETGEGHARLFRDGVPDLVALDGQVRMDRSTFFSHGKRR